MNKYWSWAGRYFAVIALALILAAVLGSMDLFQATTVISRKLTAAHIVKFLGYGAALTVFWLLGQRAALTFRAQGGRWGFLEHLVLPAVTLIVVASAHGVLLLVLAPLMDAELRNTYNWMFIAAITGTAGWLVLALFNQSSPLTEAFTSAAQRLGSTGATRACPQCGADANGTAKYCDQCSTALPG